MPFDKKPPRKTLAPRTVRSPKFEPGLPSRQQILDMIAHAEGEVGKREIAKAFSLKGNEKIQLKALLKDMAEEGLIDGRRTAYHRMGGVPKVTVLRVIEIEDGDPIAIPDNWEAEDGAPPRLRVIETRVPQKKGPQMRGVGALRPGDRILSHTEETPAGWVARPMKKLDNQTEGVMGVVEIDGAGKAWLAPIDKRERHSAPISDLGGAAAGLLVMAEPTGRSPRAGMRVVAVPGRT